MTSEILLKISLAICRAIGIFFFILFAYHVGAWALDFVARTLGPLFSKHPFYVLLALICFYIGMMIEFSDL